MRNGIMLIAILGLVGLGCDDGDDDDGGGAGGGAADVDAGSDDGAGGGEDGASADGDPAPGGGGGGAGGPEAAGGTPAAGGGPDTGRGAVTAVDIGGLTEALELGLEVQLTLTATFEDGSTEDLAEGITWRIDDAAVATISEAGMFVAVAAGETTLHASVEVEGATHEASLQVEVVCRYPRFPNQIRLGEVMPPLRWDGAYREDGSQFDFALEDVYCGGEFADTEVVIFVVGAGWCSACTVFTQRNLNPQAAALYEAGALIVYVESETASFGPASNEYSQQHISRLIGDGLGLRVGDRDTSPEANYILDSDIVQAFPTVFLVRTRDMQVIADQGRSDYYLPFLDIVENPEADWTNPGAPMFRSNCAEGDEEASEPNNSPGEASVLPPGTIQGGICEAAPDYFEIEVEGPWRVNLAFSHAAGDLDVYVWDEAVDGPLQEGGRLVGSNGTGDVEQFEHRGPALLRVEGYQGASAPYTLTLTEL